MFFSKLFHPPALFFFNILKKAGMFCWKPPYYFRIYQRYTNYLQNVSRVKKILPAGFYFVCNFMYVCLFTLRGTPLNAGSKSFNIEVRMLYTENVFLTLRRMWIFYFHFSFFSNFVNIQLMSINILIINTPH